MRFTIKYSDIKTEGSKIKTQIKPIKNKGLSFTGTLKSNSE